MTEPARPRRVLVVEDGVADAATLERYLERDEAADYEVTFAQNGEAGLERCRDERPDVVLLDFDLPDLDGLEFLDALRQIGGGASAPVVLAITGQSDPRVAAELIRRGALDYIAKKDVTEESLRLAVRQAVRTRAMRNDLERRTREREASRAELVATLERASFLASVSELLTRSLDVNSVIGTVATLAIPYLGDACFVDVIEHGTIVRRTVELSSALAARYDGLPRTAPLATATEGVGRVLRASRTAVYRKTWLPAVGLGDAAIERLSNDGAIASLIVVPLLFDERPLGAISFASVRAHGAHAQDAAEELARRASAAIANARAFEAERAAVRASEAARARLHFLSHVSALFARSLDWRAAFGELTELLVPGFCDHASATVVDGRRAQIVASRSTDADIQRLTERVVGAYAPGSVASFGTGATLSTGEAQFYGDAALFRLRFAQSMPLVAGDGSGERISAYMSVPIPGANASAAGALTLIGVDGRAFSLDDLAIAEDVGRRAGTLLQNARLFERQRDIAATLQRSLLPSELPAIDGVQFAAQLLAGAEGLEVGGDWYDVIPLPRNRVAFAVGDVAGRGLLAAAMMGQLRSSLRAYALEGLEPSDALARLNGFVLSQERAEFATVAIGVLDTETGVLRYASAGHLPPLLIEPGGAAELLPVASSLPVGLIADTMYEQSVHRLGAGTTLCLYTDGLVESRARGLDDGLAALVAAARDEDGPLEALIAKLLGLLATDAGDDVTLLALRLAPHAGTAGTSGALPVLSVTYPAVPPSSPSARHRLGAYAGSLGLSPDRVAEMQLAAGEAVANAIEHAYAAAQPGTFSLRAHVADESVVVEVLDHGVWRQRARVPPPPLPERGRGFILMQALADDLHVEHGDGGTRVHLTFGLAHRGGEPQASGIEPGAAP